MSWSSSTSRPLPTAGDPRRTWPPAWPTPLTSLSPSAAESARSADARRLLEAGADKVAVNSAAVADPSLLENMARQLGTANTVCAIDACRVCGLQCEGWTVLVRGGRTIRASTRWPGPQQAVRRGAGELLVTSHDRDGTAAGFDTALACPNQSSASVPLIASGGGGSLDSFVVAVREGKADAVLAASVFHFGVFSVRDGENRSPQRLATGSTMIEDFSTLDWRKSPDGLLPAIVQDAATARVLMLGYMNEAALQRTQETRLGHLLQPLEGPARGRRANPPAIPSASSPPRRIATATRSSSARSPTGRPATPAGNPASTRRSFPRKRSAN